MSRALPVHSSTTCVFPNGKTGIGRRRPGTGNGRPGTMRSHLLELNTGVLILDLNVLGLASPPSPYPLPLPLPPPLDPRPAPSRDAGASYCDFFSHLVALRFFIVFSMPFLNDLGSILPPNLDPKIHQNLKKSMPRGTVSWTSYVDRFLLDFCSQLRPPKAN